jgi:truncated hemoglobin YjbI
MHAAVEEAHLGALEKSQLLTYFEAAANHMVNTPDD